MAGRPSSVEQRELRRASSLYPRTGGPGMNRYENKTFENQHLVLDDGVFINCVFKNCSLEYSGGDVYVQNCQGEGCQLVWRGAAQRTVFLLQGLGLMAAPTAQPTQTLERTNRVQ